MSRLAMARYPSPASPPHRPWPELLTGLTGAWLGLALLKFGDPVVFDWLVPPPANLAEFIAISWPISWGYAVIALLAIGAIIAGWSCPKRLPWFAWLPLAWLGWQLVAASQTIDARLTGVTLKHFAACIFCFYLGLLVLPRPASRRFWGALLVGFLLVLWLGFDQHYGGLDATRKLFYELPNWRKLPPEYLKRIASNRIFSTLVYPNALAAVILLLLPPLVTLLWRSCQRWSFRWRGVTVGLFAYSGLACLVWSGSKAGWLVALVLVWLCVWQLPLGRRLKTGLIAAALVFGITGFVLRYAGYFERGATSVVARFDYWRAALTVTGHHPWLGTGPGTFSVAYRAIKPPGAEMAHLTHNDYLEQACDSGIPGFLVYSGFWIASLIHLYRHNRRSFDWFHFAVWLGLLGWSLQALVEFSLYIPASAWTALTVLGMQLRRCAFENQIDNLNPGGYSP
ncbi:MAG: O-antigen ligase family protein [Verrucomicrobia bacterium]|nr:O-antigen ligase family protein [Verrucomicrobiota bacterium]